MRTTRACMMMWVLLVVVDSSSTSSRWCATTVVMFWHSPWVQTSHSTVWCVANVVVSRITVFILYWHVYTLYLYMYTISGWRRWGGRGRGERWWGEKGLVIAILQLPLLVLIYYYYYYCYYIHCIHIYYSHITLIYTATTTIPNTHHCCITGHSRSPHEQVQQEGQGQWQSRLQAHLHTWGRFRFYLHCRTWR